MKKTTLILILLSSTLFLSAQSKPIRRGSTSTNQSSTSTSTNRSSATSKRTGSNNPQKHSSQQNRRPSSPSSRAPLNPVIQKLINNMVYVEGGTFKMGATSEQGSNVNEDERPIHEVTVSSFSIGRYEVSQEEWEIVIGENVSRFKDASDAKTRPVEQVNWDDCQEFIRKLNNMTGKKFRLPTEAEWEFAARGGKKSHGYKYAGGNDISSVAWFDDNSGRGTHRVGTKKPNELGLYDMSGNVSEWCGDWDNVYSSFSQTNPKGASLGEMRVIRGGGWESVDSLCRVSKRSRCEPEYGFDNLGFRLVLDQHTSEYSSSEIEKKRIIDNLISNMVYITGGTFTMGATSEQGSDAYANEKPIHQVTLSSFSIGRFEVTQEEWDAVMSSNLSYFKGAKRPVENVSWDDCQEFIRKLNEMTGKDFRLPTEAEWEFAARGGNNSLGYKYVGGNDIGFIAWYYENSGNVRLNEKERDFEQLNNNICQTHDVGQKQPNELGLYDMSGNVYEWCNDRSGDYKSSSQTNPKGENTGYVRVLRGGGWNSDAAQCRVSFRGSFYTYGRNGNLGFRLAL